MELELEGIILCLHIKQLPIKTIYTDSETVFIVFNIKNHPKRIAS